MAGVVLVTKSLAAAFDQVIHRDGKNWTDAPGFLFFGDPRGRRSTQEGDVFVLGASTAHLVLPIATECSSIFSSHFCPRSFQPVQEIPPA